MGSSSSALVDPTTPLQAQTGFTKRELQQLYARFCRVKAPTAIDLSAEVPKHVLREHKELHTHTIFQFFLERASARSWLTFEQLAVLLSCFSSRATAETKADYLFNRLEVGGRVDAAALVPLLSTLLRLQLAPDAIRALAQQFVAAHGTDGSLDRTQFRQHISATLPDLVDRLAIPNMLR
eukprot:m.150910 g.150910  ORF g.150910 m.150910 type:complete len:180 (-) comp9750_c0_seq3:406-945(-)